MQRKTKIILIVALLLFLGIGIYNEQTEIVDLDFIYYKNTTGIIGENDLGTVEKYVYGNPNATKTIALITGIHPREKLAIDPEIKAAKEFGNETNDTKILHYQVNVTKNPKNYKKGRANGESLVHDFVNPDVTHSDADCVIISHSHVEWYGEGFYLATPEMDKPSVKIAKKINNTTDFGYYPRTGNETYKSTSAILVSKPIAQAGYPTFVYEIPENITKQDSTDMAKELFRLMVKYT
ncbi:hypothetical protein [Methanobrevibacter sp.]|uniref:hypothetical protein n=1 Tax=Methanobrevibacter sp. TaxID=66852 RepID=UPI00386B4A1F